MDDQELAAKLKKLSFDELMAYDKTIRIAGILLSSAGIGLILLALIYPNIFVIIISVFGVYTFSRMAVELQLVKEYIISLIAKLYPSDK